MEIDPMQSLLKMHALLDELDVPHALCGGVAANLYRDEVRATEDVDLAVILESPRLKEVVDALAASGWAAEPYWKHGNQLRLSAAGYARVDCVVAGTDLERSAITRARMVDLAGVQIPVLVAEDLVVLKLIAGRSRDIDAVASILRAQGDALDLEYITSWVEVFDATDAWERATREA